MRYYRIEIGESPAGTQAAVYTSLVNGLADPGALQVEFDIPVTPFGNPIGDAWVRIWGVSLQTISQAKDFNGAQITVSAGMTKGLPLANPAQAGVLMSGVINQAFGNWVDTTMTLEFIVVTDGGASLGDPANIVLDWKKGTTLAAALRNTLSTAYPAYTLNINISDDLVLTEDEAGYFSTIQQLASYAQEISRQIKGGDYTGVQITIRENTFNVYDGTTVATPKLIDFVDLIGQPTWIESPTIQFNCALRADLAVGEYIRLPAGQATTTQQSFSQFRDRTAFQGVFQIDMVRHVGNSRDPMATSWITVYNAHPTSGVPAPGSLIGRLIG